MKKSFDETIFEKANSWIKLKQKVVLATVIQTWGSSPHQIGSRMIINESGDFSGSVSGGLGLDYQRCSGSIWCSVPGGPYLVFRVWD